MGFICSSSFQIAEISLIFVALYLVSNREASARHNFLSRLFSWCCILENRICYVWFHSDNYFLMPSSVLRCDVSLGKPQNQYPVISGFLQHKRRENQVVFFSGWTRKYCLIVFLMQKQQSSVTIQSCIKARWRSITDFTSGEMLAVAWVYWRTGTDLFPKCFKMKSYKYRLYYTLYRRTV